jgi:hypothetical protein
MTNGYEMIKGDEMLNIRNFTQYLSIIVTTLALTACSSSGGDSGSSVCDPPAGDYAGFWTISGTDQGNCGDEGSWSGSGTITVDGNTMTGFPAGGGTHSGQVCANTLTVATSYPEDGGTVTLNFTATFSSNNAVSGSGTWSWTDGSSSCNGTTSFQGTKL